MDLFTSDGFEKGAWASELRNRIKSVRMDEESLAEWECTLKMWHWTYQRWVQFQPPQLGAFFWSGKPAVMSDRNGLYAGYYVERGLPDDVATAEQRANEQVIGPTWHWNSFWPLLKDHPEDLYATIVKLPAERRCVWVCDSTLKLETTEARSSEPGTPYLITQLSDLTAAKGRIEEIIRYHNHWIDVIAGVQYTKGECMNRNKWPSIIQGILSSLELTAELVPKCSRPQPLAAG